MDEKSRLKQIKEKVQRWKNEGYNVEELQHKLNSMNIQHPDKSSKRKAVIGAIIAIIIIFGLCGIYFYYEQIMTDKKYISNPYIFEPYTLGNISFKSDILEPVNASLGFITNENLAIQAEVKYLFHNIAGKDVISSIQAEFYDINNNLLAIKGPKLISLPEGYTETSFTPANIILYDGEFVSEIDHVKIIVSEIKNNPIAVINTSKGVIKIELYEDKVPNTCVNFINLVNDGFYNNLVFHRVIDGFVIQGGGYYSDGIKKESPYGTINLEINSEVHHVDGAIAMARAADLNSASSLFYICDGVQSFLDGQYAVFGVTIEGLDVVRTIASVPTTIKYGFQDWPINDVIINSIVIENV